MYIVGVQLSLSVVLTSCNWCIRLVVCTEYWSRNIRNKPFISCTFSSYIGSTVGKPYFELFFYTAHRYVNIEINFSVCA